MPKDLFQGVKINDTKFVLNGPDHHHCSRVTRHKIADQILVSDFDGSIYIAIIQEISADSTINLFNRGEKSKNKHRDKPNTTDG